jgi:hypothetical protein
MRRLVDGEELFDLITEAVEDGRFHDGDAFIQLGDERQPVRSVAAGATVGEGRIIEWPDGSYYRPGYLHAAGTPRHAIATHV